ncbi:PKD domain-containing protein [Parasegetibacter sp. NRK P23]|uniref:PKD domain-containing protein n=1 Tax=Parasegetibacter sp. NRK P23 TaxID=2942999 RepID=UPI0020432BCE|nr:PKD domain-containing protein [Parasegetibacter sp. NRK P23]MCM5529043.1 PKD domain-containing protein [Parasegetibacter sp. NRK P23]
MYPLHYTRLLLTLFVCLAFKAAGAQVPVAQFTANVTQGCAPLSVRFTDQSTGSPQFWNWDFGNGQLSNLQNPTVNFSTPGTYTVTLVVRNQDGVDGETKTGYITVNPSPVAAFEANLTEGCLGSTIRFTDRSTDAGGTITAWSWDFGDGTTSTQRNPSKQYTANGFYTVTLTVTSSTGCRRTVSRGRYIRILSGITNAFRHAQDSVCRAPFPVRFTNESAGPGTLSYNWNFGNGTTSTDKDPTANFSAPGTYNITLVTTSALGCSETLTRSITVTGANPAISAGTVACIETPFPFTNNSSPAPVSSTWDFGDGNTSTATSPSHTYNTAGTYQVKLVTDFGFCKDSVTRALTVTPRPAVNFSASGRTGCAAPLTTNFTANAPGAVSWNWDFGDGNSSNLANPSHTYSTAGNYNVSLTITNANGCTNTIRQDNYIRIRQPQINTASLQGAGCAPYTYTPTPVVNTVVPVTSWLWDFGDGTTSNVQNPTHVYTNTGNYTVILTVSGPGCNTTVTATNAVRVGSSPGTAFTSSATQSCVGSGIQFTNTSAQSDAWEWDFGDGNTSTEENPAHSYAEPGTYTIRFVAINNGCRQEITNTNYITVLPPLARFDFAVQCPDFREVVFTNNSLIDNTQTVSYLWEFGDATASTSTNPNPSFIFPAVGSYNVALTVTNGTCSHRIQREVIITSQSADVSVSNNNACKHERITVSAINSDPTLIRSYEWRINGGTPFAGGRSFDTSFANNGNYTISLTITDINGCVTSLGTPVSIAVTGPVPGLSASNTGACVNGDITLNSTATSSNGISRYRWDFGDGNIIDNSTASVVHRYANSGNYLPSLTIADTRGCTDTAFIPVALQITSPKAGFDISDTLFCPTLPVQFTDTSSGYNLSYRWDFGNGNTSAEQNPTQEFRGGDTTYTIFLEVTDGYGCVDSIRKENLIRIVNPVAAFMVSDSLFLCAPAEVQFTNQSAGYEALLWDFNNDNTSTLENPNQFFNNIGVYNVKLYAYGFGGCVDSAVQAIRFPDPGTTVMNYSPITACNEITTNFTISPIEGLSYNFLFGDGQDTTGATSFSHRYGSPGTYAPRITYTDRMGCIASVGGPSTIRVSGAIVAFAKDRKEFCDNGAVSFTNYTIPLAADPINSINWNFGDGGTSTDQNPNYQFNHPGTFPVTLNVSTQAGCTSTFSDTIRVYRTPSPIINTLPGICVFDTLDINGSLAFADTSITWRWSIGNGMNLTGPEHRVVFNSPGTITANLSAANLLNCTGSTSATIEVYPLPEIQVPTNITVPSGGSAPLQLSYSQEVTSWTWTPSTALSCTNCAQPIANPQFNTVYTVAVVDQNGCRNTAEVPVTVICNTLNFFIPNTFSPNKDGMNDVFYPRGKGIERIASMRVFNRWGQIMFEKRNFGANDPAMGWDGNFQGKPASSDTYVYVVELICENATIIPYKGNVTLIR